MKKTLLFLLIPLLFLCACRVIETPEPLLTEEDWDLSRHEPLSQYEEGGLLFQIYTDKTASLLEYDKNTLTDFEIAIPDTVKEIPVTSIAPRAFQNAPFRRIALPAFLTEIGEQAFQKCAIEEIILPETLETMGKEAFDNCLNLKTLRFSGAPKRIPVGAFYACVSLKEIVLPEGVEVLEEEAFASCTGAEKISLPSTLKEIGPYAFWRTGKGLEIAVPDGCTVGEHAFDD